MRCFSNSRTLSICERHSTSNSSPSSSSDSSSSSSFSDDQREGTTSIVNNTAHTILLRDKHKNQFGRLRHSVLPNSAQIVPADLVGTMTYYQMGLLAKTDTSGEEGNTQILIDTDDLAVHDRIVVSARRNGQFAVKKFKRKF